MQGRLVVGIALALGLSSPELASGATVSVAPVGAHETNEVFYTAGKGETNDVVASTDGATVTVHDPGAQIQAGNDCAASRQHTARCNLPGPGLLNFDLRDGDDTGRITGPRIVLVSAEGGPGRDRLVGTRRLPDRFNGGRGPDVIEGKDGHNDTVYYTGRPDDIHVTLGDGNRNEGGPRDGALRDRLAGIENVVSGNGDDLLVGNGHKNDLFGGAGRDLLRGKGGYDHLGGMAGRDTAYGGLRGDTFPGDPGNDDRFGGKGHDLLQGGSPNNGADLFMGGAGHDIAGYYFGPVRLSLDGKPNDGPCANPACTSSNEGDNLVSIENLYATSGRDVLIGSERNNRFWPWQGADTVRAKGGDDDVDLFQDNDVDDIDCGPGEDLIFGTPDAFDMFKNCE
jgi:Ca2+-binding RTX toxin-like protein